MRQLYIIRGLPGVGKSTLGHALGSVVFEADQYFIGEDGKYNYDRAKIADAHKFCQDECRKAMEMGYNSIAVANTFVHRWEMEHYYAMADHHNYRVTEITVSGELHENTHGVSLETIERMRSEWER